MLWSTSYIQKSRKALTTKYLDIYQLDIHVKAQLGSPSLSFSLSLRLYHSHTHVHPHTNSVTFPLYTDSLVFLFSVSPSLSQDCG